MGRFGGIWFSAAAISAAAAPQDAPLDAEDVTGGHVSLLQTRAELLGGQVPGDVVSRIADQDLLGKREAVHPHRAQMRLHKAARGARAVKSSSAGSQHLLREIMDDAEGDGQEESRWRSRAERQQEAIGWKGSEQTDAGDDADFQVFEGETRDQQPVEANKEGRALADNAKVQHTDGLQCYHHDKASMCGDCGSANDLNAGLGGTCFDKATRTSSMDVCGPVCDSHAECAGFNFVESSGRCYYRRSTACQTSSDTDRDCYTKASYANVEDELLAAAGSDVIEGPQDKTQDEISQCRPYMESTGCGWTKEWSCPDQRSGSLGVAGMKNGQDTLGFRCCCTHGLWAVDTTVNNKDAVKTASKHHVEKAFVDSTNHANDLSEIKHVHKSAQAGDAKLGGTSNKGQRKSKFKRREEVKHAGKWEKVSKVERRKNAKHAGAKELEEREDSKHASKGKKVRQVERHHEVGRVETGEKSSKLIHGEVKHAGREKRATKVEGRERIDRADKGRKASKTENRAMGKPARSHNVARTRRKIIVRP